jgi:hypothetical protein
MTLIKEQSLNDFVFVILKNSKGTMKEKCYSSDTIVRPGSDKIILKNQDIMFCIFHLVGFSSNLS